MKKRVVMTLLASVIILALVLAGCAAPTVAPAGESGAPMSDGMVEITYTYAGRGVPTDLQMVQDAMNVILNEKIGVNLSLEPIDFGAYNDKMQLRLSAGEECDIIFTAPWTNSYANNVANGVLAPLDDLLLNHAPGLWGSMPESTWDAARVNGTIYGVINQQIFPKPWGVHPRKDLADTYGLDLDTVETWEDMEPWLEAVRDGEGITPVFVAAPGRGLWLEQYYGYDPLDDGIKFLGMRAEDESLTALNTVDTIEFQQAADTTKRWVDEGLMPLEPLPNDEAQAAFRAGQFAMGYHVEKPGNDVEAQTAYGFEFVMKNLTNPLILDTAGATATMNGICTTSQNPEKAMEVLEEFNTNPDIYNLLSRGIKDTHWVWEDEANLVMTYPEGVTADTSTYNPNTDWMFGNQFLAYYRDAKQVGAWEATKEMNDNAFPSEALGFVVDREPIKTEIAQTSAVYEEMVLPIVYGWVSYAENAPAAIDALNAAGAQTIIDEVNSQLQEWRAANPR
ncbi:MAG: ABC transporter substrate-binding protein [Chloroflexota bacterium]